MLAFTLFSLPQASFASSPGPINPLAPKAIAAFQSAYLSEDSSVARQQSLNTLFEGNALIEALESVAAHGLNPEDYHLADLREHGMTGDDMAIYALDAWMSAASHMAFGKISPTSVEPDWTAKGRQADLVAHLMAALEAGTLASSLDELAPQHRAYQALKEDLAGRLSQPARTDVVIPQGPTLKPGMSGERVRVLQRRLLFPETGEFDADTEAAVVAFQSESGLDDNGLVGPATLRALNRGDAAIRDQLRVNLERWRWLPDDLGRRHVRVNIADFSVQAWKDGAIDRVHGAIVGKTYRKTPVFSNRISYIVLNPWWETPPSLALRDKLPMFKRDPESVERLGFQVLDRSGQRVESSMIDWTSIPAGTMPYRLRQAPGPRNALGQVKIMFPNPHNVYLHDTPDRGLFAQRQRAFSSGCIRTQDPLDLSEWLLSETPDWDRARMDEALATGSERRINLAASVPVHILYMTAVNDAAGVRLVDDIYDRDGKVLAGLNTRPANS